MVEMRVIVMEMNVEISVEMVMLNRLILLVFFILLGNRNLISFIAPFLRLLLRLIFLAGISVA